MNDTTTPYATMADVRAANKEAGMNWFSKDSMQFFDSRVETVLYRGRYFITSEQDHHGGAPRTFTVRYAQDDGDILTIGGFGEHATLTAAMNAMWADINGDGTA